MSCVGFACFGPAELFAVDACAIVWPIPTLSQPCSRPGCKLCQHSGVVPTGCAVHVVGIIPVDICSV